jgi:hypothetical protein
MAEAEEAAERGIIPQLAQYRAALKATIKSMEHVNAARLPHYLP